MYTMIFNILGLPATTVPMGLYKGLPVGIQVIVKDFDLSYLRTHKNNRAIFKLNGYTFHKYKMCNLVLDLYLSVFILQVVAAPNQDRLCLAVAKELEKGFGGWRPPQ